MSAPAGVLGAVVALFAPAAAFAGPLNELPYQGSAPDVAVDDGGTGHFAWTQSVSSGNGRDHVHYCKVPRGGTTADCIASHKDFEMAGETRGDRHPARVFVNSAGTSVRVFFGVDTNGANTPADGSYALDSATSGATFSGPTRVASEIAHDYAAGPNDNPFVPNNFSLVPYFGERYQRALLGGAAVTAFTDLSNPNLLVQAEVEVAAGGKPVIAYYDTNTSRVMERHFTGANNAELNDATKWTAPATATPDSGTTPLRLASTPAGALYLATQGPSLPNPVVVRKWNGTSFGTPVAVANESGTHFDMKTDRSGRIHVIWRTSDGTGIRHSYSSDGGTTWSTPATVAVNAGGFFPDKRVGAASDGAGFAVMSLGFGVDGGVERIGFSSLEPVAAGGSTGTGTAPGTAGTGTGGGGGTTPPKTVSKSVTLGNQIFTVSAPAACVKAGSMLRVSIKAKTKPKAKPLPGFKVTRLDALIDGKLKAYVIASNVKKVLKKGYLDFRTAKTKKSPALGKGTKHTAAVRIRYRKGAGKHPKKRTATLALPFTICK